MFRLERLLHIAILVTVSLSGILLGLGQGDMSLTAVALAGAMFALLVTEQLNWFHFDQWVANVAALLVLLYTAGDFGMGDSGQQLRAVAQLLVWLQTILLFQRKTPRVYWQVLVLSLLQVVVAAVFNLGFEGGLLFITYMIVAGGTMMLLQLHHDTWSIVEANRKVRSRHRLQMQRAAREGGAVLAEPVALFDQSCRDRGIVHRMLRHLGSLGIVAVGFAAVLFYFIPRDASSWMGPDESELSETGQSKFVNLSYRGLISLSREVELRLTLLRDGEHVQLSEEPYIRGLPLPNLVLENGATSWKAPYNRVYDSSYVAVSEFAPRAGRMDQEIVLEATTDPLIYGVTPYFRLPNATPDDIRVCLPLSALTRKKDEKEKINLVPYQYRLGMSVRQGNQPVPWFPPDPPSVITFESDPGRYNWLINMDLRRYPQLVRTARDVVNQLNSAERDHWEIAQALEQHFLDDNRYSYTLNLEAIDWNTSVDPVEDFVANHRSGHCEFFASALTLMLRSQGIPAQLVVGFRGGNFNAIGKYYQVEKRHAHAWVEAYIRPQDVPPQWQRDGMPTQSGGWVRLDPTPPSNFDDSGFFSTADDIWGMLHSGWRDYILGSDGGGSNDNWRNTPVASITQVLSFSWWRTQLAAARNLFDNPASPVWYLRFAAPLMLVAVLVLAWRRWKRRAPRDPSVRPRRGIRLRRMLADAVSMISPELGRWVESKVRRNIPKVAFYQKLVRLLKRHGLQRQSHQTQREFAAVAARRFSENGDPPAIQHELQRIIDHFYQVRFGRHPLSPEQARAVARSLTELEQQLASASKARTAPDQ